MTTVKKPAARKVAGTSMPKLPVMSVQRFEESLVLVERIAKEERQGFLAEMQAFRQEHRDITRRPLTAEESAQVASTMAAMVNERPEPEYVAAVQDSDLYVYDDPAERDVLVAGGLATAPALVRALRRFVALIEMDNTVFEEACEHDQLADVIDEHARALSKDTLANGRTRTMTAFEHWGKQAGVASGEVMRRLIETVMGALEQAATRISAQGSPARSHLSTDSLAPTGGLAETSSTTSPIETP